MSEPPFLLSRTLASTLVGTMEELQVQQTVQEQLVPPSLPLRKSSTWLSFRAFLRSRTRILLQHLNVGIVDFEFSMFVGSMLSISTYVCLLTLSGDASRNGAFASSNQPESSLEETSVKALLQGPYQWNNGRFGGDVRLHEEWSGIPSTESVDSEMVVSFDNDLEGKKPQSSLETVDGFHC